MEPMIITSPITTPRMPMTAMALERESGTRENMPQIVKPPTRSKTPATMDKITAAVGLRGGIWELKLNPCHHR